jgi:uncharacterized membrane protein YkoI
MAISEDVAINKAAEVVKNARAVDSTDFEVTSTYKASGRWRIKFDVNGDTVTVRLDAETGNLAGAEGHSQTSENLQP